MDQDVCSECWYEQNTAPPTERVDKQTSCDVCGKELVQVIVMTNHEESDDEEEAEPVEVGVSLRRHVCTQEYAYVYVEVPASWADDLGYWEDEIREMTDNIGYVDWELETDVHSEEDAEVVDMEVV